MSTLLLFWVSLKALRLQNIQSGKEIVLGSRDVLTIDVFSKYFATWLNVIQTQPPRQARSMITKKTIFHIDLSILFELL